MTAIGVVTQIDAGTGEVWAELSRIAPGFHIGPMKVLGEMPSAIGDLVAVDEVQGQRGTWLCFGAITGGVPASGGSSSVVESIHFTIPGPLTVASPSQLLLPIAVDSTFLSLQLVLAGAASGGAVSFDVLYNGTAQNPDAAMTSIYGASKPAITNGGRGYWNGIVPATTAFIADSLLRVDVLSVGGTSPGKGLTGVLRLQQAAPPT
jgi:hypothetical protein